MAQLAIELYRHHRWANVTLLDACLDLTGEQLAATIPGAAGSLHQILWHMLSSEEGYLRRATGVPTPDRLSRRATAPSIAELQTRAKTTGDRLIDAATSLDPDTIVHEEWQGEPSEFPAFVPLLQAIDHGGEHREQVKSILTSLGIEPPWLDVWGWRDAGMP